MAKGRKGRRNARRNAEAALSSSNSDDDEGYIRIGGVRVNVNRSGTVTSINRGKRLSVGVTATRMPQPSSQGNTGEIDSGNEGFPGYEPDDAVLDYLENIIQSSEDEEGSKEGKGEAAAVVGDATRSKQVHIEMLRRFGRVELGDEGAVEDIIGRGMTSSSDDSEEEDDAWSYGSSSGGRKGNDSESSFSSDDDDAEEGECGEKGIDSQQEGIKADIGVYTEEELTHLSLEMRYPVQSRPLPAPAHGPAATLKHGGKKQKRAKSGGKKGSKGGKLPPGEKARLRREGIEGRRASRAVGRGFDLAGVNKALQDFVETAADVYIFPAMAKQECSQVQRLATLYGCKSGAQGSGKKRSVVVTLTERTSFPEGAALLEVGRLLAEHSAAEIRAAGIPRAKGGHPPPPLLTGDSRWAGLKKHNITGRSQGKGRNRGSGRWGDDDVASELFTGDAPRQGAKRKSSKPVVFISRGNIIPDDPTEIFAPKSASATHQRSGPSKISAAEHLGGAGSQTVDDEEEPAMLLPVFEERGGTSGTATRTATESSHPKSGKSRGEVAAEGITNSGRLLGLGMALGLGAEIFGGPGIGAVAGSEDEEDADLSPLQPQLSKSARRKMDKRRRSGRGGGSAVVDQGASGSPDDERERQRLGVGVSGDYADFERHGTGIGSRLLAKWGFAGEGSGLGREGTGIAEPVVATQRAKKLGLGAWKT